MVILFNEYLKDGVFNEKATVKIEMNNDSLRLIRLYEHWGQVIEHLMK